MRSVEQQCFDPTKYRRPEEVEQWERRDPLIRLRRHLEAKGLWDEARETALREEVKALVDAEVRQYEAMKNLPAEAAFDNVLASPPPFTAAQKESFMRRQREA